ncbi:MAG TPA: hypothetical protein VLN73_07290, partial [Alphaproteobacteria bacterium]|nr:hypothetical protein [Alphaproteobacteria bacterium]
MRSAGARASCVWLSVRCGRAGGLGGWIFASCCSGAAGAGLSAFRCGGCGGRGALDPGDANGSSGGLVASLEGSATFR